jgi:1-phosphofructokinase family hexose kinase
MILTVTLNPLLERRMKYENITMGIENRNGVEELKVGGKGINVSRQLNNLGSDNLAFTFLGGENGKIVKELLFKEDIKNTSVRTKSETRNSYIILEENAGRLTSCFGKNQEISAGEADEFKNKLEKIIQNCEIAVFSGSSPSRAADDIFPFGIELANKYDKISVLDTYGPHLAECINAGPTIVHNNRDEVENSLGVKLSSAEEVIAHLRFLYSKGVKQSFLTDGAGKINAANFDFIYSASFEPVADVKDSTGSGDAFTAGIVYGLENDYTFEQSLTLAVKLGLKNTRSFEACNIKKEELESFTGMINITPVGKKMKILDVTPT